MGTDLMTVSAHYFALRHLLPSGINPVFFKDPIHIVNFFGSR
jgi:hypothetical protein